MIYGINIYYMNIIVVMALPVAVQNNHLISVSVYGETS